MTVAPLVAAYNLQQFRGEKIRPGLDRLNGAAVIAALECKGNHVALAKWRTDHANYPTSVTGQPGEGQSTKLLIRRGVKVYESGVITVVSSWRGPFGGKHPGRSFPWATVDLDGQRVTVVGVHMPWSRTRNFRSWMACFRALVAFARQHKGPMILVGDFNLRWGARGPGAVRRLAKYAGMSHVPTGAGIDYALARGVRLTGRALGHFGSDHPAITLRSKP